MSYPRNLIIAGLILLAFAAAACQRTATDGHSINGPSTYVLTYSLTAAPNVIMAGDFRPTSIIRSVVTEDNRPAAGRTVYFTLINGVGEFTNLSPRITVVTDGNGVAQTTYIGPTKYEIDGDTTATIMGQLETSSPQVVAKTVDLTILISTE